MEKMLEKWPLARFWNIRRCDGDTYSVNMQRDNVDHIRNRSCLDKMTAISQTTFSNEFPRLWIEKHLGSSAVLALSNVRAIDRINTQFRSFQPWWDVGHLLPTWFSFNPNVDYIHHKMWHKVTHPYLNFNGAACLALSYYRNLRWITVNWTLRAS